MGCFNMSCFISRLDIKREDKCMVLPILPNPRSDSLNDRAFRYFKPFCLPIYGQYNDYGGLEKIRKDSNTAALEEYFEMTIEQFVEIVTVRRGQLYGQYSEIQKAYGHPVLKTTPEDLAKIHFKTDENGVMTHPMIDWLFNWIRDSKTIPADQKPKREVKMYWNKEGDLVLEGWYDKPQTYKRGEDATSYSKFLPTVHELYERYAVRGWLPREPFIFGIPSDKQERALLLSKMQVAFIRTDVYKAFAKTAKKLCVGNRSRWDKTDWMKKRSDEYTKVCTEYQKMVRKVTNMRSMKDKLSTEEREKMAELSCECRNFEQIWHSTGLYGFQSTYRGTEFLTIYLTRLLTPEFRAAVDEFSWMEYGLSAANILLLDARSLEQHGDVGEEMALLRTIAKVGEKLLKERQSEW